MVKITRQSFGCRVLKGGCSRGGCNWGTLRIPREDWGTLVQPVHNTKLASFALEESRTKNQIILERCSDNIQI